mgnify:FL=1
MKFKFTVTLATLCLLAFAACNNTTVESPDKSISFRLELDKNGVPRYSVKRSGEEIIEKSQLGFILSDGENLAEGFKIK